MSYTEGVEDLLGDILDCSDGEDAEGPLGDTEDGDDNKGEEVQVPQPVEVKRRVVKNPQPKLNSQRLSGPRGVHTIEQYFADFKFKGKHHEHTDLNRVMKRLEHWAHRLFPKFQFDDCLERLERLGRQRVVMSYMNMYRHDLLQPDDPGNVPTDNLDDQLEEDVLAAPLDEIDELLDQQLALARSHTVNKDATFDSLIQSPSSRFGQSPKPTSTPYPVGRPVDPPREIPPALTDEQRERIALNRQKAQERLLLRKKMEAEAAASLAEDNAINTEVVMDETV